MPTLRVATARDTDAIIAIDGLARADAARRACIARWAATGQAWVACEGSEVAAYAAFEYSFFEHGLIRMVWVVPHARRRGVGAALVRTLEGACTSPKLFVSTNESNVAMRALLTSLGYQPCGAIDALDEGDPELFFVKRLCLRAR